MLDQSQFDIFCVTHIKTVKFGTIEDVVIEHKKTLLCHGWGG